MRLAITSNSASVGNVDIHETFRVIELDAGQYVETTKSTGLDGRSDSMSFSREALSAIETQLAIVVPCKDEAVSILDGVLHGIPHDCLIILVSNSKKDNFTAECNLLSDFCTDTRRSGIACHQHDPGFAEAFVAGGLPAIVRVVNGRPQIRNGKGEAMMMGAALAKLAGKKYIGFIDADNLVSGAVHEYCKVYAAGLHYALHCTGDGGQPDTDAMTPHCMVRIKWNSKPKVKDGIIIFEKLGRSSRVVNQWMNRLLTTVLGDEPEGNLQLIETGNAGEHAMSTDLAMDLKFATGYAVEPFQYIDAWERFSGRKFGDPESRLAQQSYDYEFLANDAAYTSSDESTLSSSASVSPISTPATSRPPSLMPALPAHEVRILQVQTRNPHFHDTSKGADHISAMQAGGLSTIYHSALTPQDLKDDLRQYFKDNLSDVKGVAEDGTPEAPRCYPSMSAMDFEVFHAKVKARNETMTVIGECGYNMLGCYQCAVRCMTSSD
ncbi:hypothetical protein HBI81_185910 [Parastagonospora nodorum]|nr:hypothetical protein HBH52_213180 [Parastagonospora nodorum]KAH4044065.1 hypothetical protein HBH49_224900 [Parastagonospora nodorum]KAH5238510.1 hypothetical protein HBI71_231030 [Parastagonospora nodorum]KAH5469098.1 hypothetical protein HBI31_196660 [Parastagonospora nodorum]KAH6330334.1 hypothetical protein HBI37_187810 [Parastagonospora nodorum]